MVVRDAFASRPSTLFLDSCQKGPDFARGPQMVHPLQCRGVGHELPVSGRQVAVATRDDAIAAEATAPQRTVLRPARGACEKPFDEALGHPSVVSRERQI